MSEDCYFFIDIEVPEDEQHMEVLCIGCHDEHHPELGWFWKGSEFGYGPWEYICCKCKRNVNEETTSTSKDPRREVLPV
jgi:hypothetical protein